MRRFPKCGTTALAHYLDSLEDVSVADVRSQRLGEDFFFYMSELLPTRAGVPRGVEASAWRSSGREGVLRRMFTTFIRDSN